MTCVVGLRTEDDVYIAVDSIAVENWNKIIRKDKKMFFKNGFLFGFAESFRAGQLLQFVLEMPEYKENEKDVFEYLCVDFVLALRTCYAQHGFQRKFEEGEEKGSLAMIGYKNRLFVLESDFQIEESFSNYNAIGVGKNMALGALCALEQVNSNLNPREKLEIALVASEQWSCAVAPPFYVSKYSDFKKESPNKNNVECKEDLLTL